MGRLTRRVRGAVRREAQDLLRGGPPTADLLRPIGPAVPSDAQVQQVLDVCMRVGEVLLGCGEPAEETSETMLRMAAALGLATVDVDITFNSITMCCHRGMVAAPLTTMRLVRYRTTDLTRLAAVTRIVAAGGARGPWRARRGGRAGRGRRGPPPVPALGGDRWAGRGRRPRSRCCSAGRPSSRPPRSRSPRSSTGSAACSAGSGSRRSSCSSIGAMVATVSTLALFGVGALPAGTQPSLVIAAGITVLLSGLSVVGSVQDAISGYYVTAAGRAAEVGLLSAGLLAGVVLGLKLGVAFSLTLDPAAPVSADVGQFGISTFAAATAAAMYALATYAPLRSLLAAALAGGIGWAVYGALTLFAHFGPVVSTGVAATFVGIATGVARRGTGVHSHVIVLAGIIPLLPGLTAYRGFYQLAVQGVVDGLVTVLLALAIGLALAAGVALGNFVARPRPHLGPGRGRVG